MGEMASGIAHDLSNALSPIVGYAELLLLSPQMLDDRPTTLEFLQTIQKEAVQASEVVKRLKEFYRAHEGGAISQPVDLNRVVEESVVVTAPKWRDEALARGLVVTIEKDLTEVPKIAGDAPQLQNVMTNLIFNAVDAHKRQGTIRFHTWPEGDWVVLEVSDTGSGMTEEVRRRCQEPFFTTKGPKGTGMGLSMVQGIIKRHQGTIDIRSEVGRGTTFVIRLPVWKAPAAGANEAPEQVSGEVGQLHILTVDDEQTVRDIVRAFLRSGGHAVETTGNGREALEKFRSGKFDLVVTDMAMPEMAGDELAAAVKAISPGTPVILLTGFGELLKFSGQAPKGVDQVVNKPVKAKTLLDAVRRAWAGRKE
jgi:CheY-like chemotaxis protein